MEPRATAAAAGSNHTFWTTLTRFVITHIATLLMCGCSFWKLLVMTQAVEPTLVTEIASSVGVGIGVWLSVGRYGREEAAKMKQSETPQTEAGSKPTQSKRRGFIKRL